MSVTFNNSSSQLASSASLLQAAGGYPISMFCWVKPTTTTPNKFVMAAGTTSEELAIYATPTNMRAWTFARGSGSNGPNSTTSCQTSWQPVLAVFTSGTSCTIYYAAGAAVTVNPAVGDALVFGSTSRFYVGRRAHASDYFFGGDIAEVALWSSALTQGNFDSLAAGATPESVASGSIIDVWDLVTDGATQTGRVNSTVLTATSTAQGATHPITRSDATAPVLSSPVGTQTGSTTATIGATTDEGNGTLYGFVSTSATPPSDADLKAGTGAVWAGSASVSSTGAKTLSATGLTASTAYYAHLLHTDAATNDSNTVTSAQFTTAAGGGGSSIAAISNNLSRRRRA